MALATANLISNAILLASSVPKERLGIVQPIIVLNALIAVHPAIVQSAFLV